MAKRVPASGRYVSVDVFVYECVCLHVNIHLYTCMSHIPSCLRVHDTYAHAQLQHVGGARQTQKEGKGGGGEQHMTQQTSEETKEDTHRRHYLPPQWCNEYLAGECTHALALRHAPRCPPPSNVPHCEWRSVCAHQPSVRMLATAGMSTCDHAQA